jgi:hypothetical protein
VIWYQFTVVFGRNESVGRGKRSRVLEVINFFVGSQIRPRLGGQTK